MSLGRHKSLGNRGDTIVEVLVVLAVLSLAISISYATANRSLLAARQAQESSRGGVLLQSQLEKLRALAALPRTPTPPPADKDAFQAGPYCIADGLGTDPPGTYSVKAFPGVVPPDCKLDSRGQRGCTTEPCYAITVTYDASAADTFTLLAGWADVAGQGTDTATLSHRIHKYVPYVADPTAPGGCLTICIVSPVKKQYVPTDTVVSIAFGPAYRTGTYTLNYVDNYGNENTTTTPENAPPSGTTTVPVHFSFTGPYTLQASQSSSGTSSIAVKVNVY